MNYVTMNQQKSTVVYFNGDIKQCKQLVALFEIFNF
jgi:hypothetical protein